MINNNLANLKGKQGMTLVEIIAGVAIVGMIVVMVLTVFSAGMMITVNAGDNTAVTGDAIAKVNTAIVTYTNTGTTSATVYFSSNKSDSTHTVSGTLFSKDGLPNTKNTATMRAFEPTKVNP